jgi:hypothetical protein
VLKGDIMNLTKHSLTINLNEILQEAPPYPHIYWDGEALNAYAYARASAEGFDMESKVHITYYPRKRTVVIWQNILECEINLN